MRIHPLIGAYRIVSGEMSSKPYKKCGAFLVPYGGNVIRVIVHDGRGTGWEHVSVSLEHRYPTWKEMCYIKSLFFEEEETVIQFHPPKSQQVNKHPYCLHLWRQVGVEVTLPPKELI